MRISLVLGLAVLLILAIAGMALAAPAGNANNGKTLFASKCASCHGPEGEGKDAIAKMFKVQMKPLGSKEVQSLTDAVLKKDIVEGNGKMKPVKVTDAEAADIIAFVRTLAKK